MAIPTTTRCDTYHKSLRSTGRNESSGKNNSATCFVDIGRLVGGLYSSSQFDKYIGLKGLVYIRCSMCDRYFAALLAHAAIFTVLYHTGPFCTVLVMMFRAIHDMLHGFPKQRIFNNTRHSCTVPPIGPLLPVLSMTPSSTFRALNIVATTRTRMMVSY